MSAYEIYLLIHIGAAIVWIGAAFVIALLTTRATVGRDPARLRTFVHEGEWLGPRVFLPSNLAVLASAILLVHEGHWSYGQLWIRLGIVGLATSFLVGALFIGPNWSRVARRVEAEGISTVGVEKQVRRLLFVAWLDLGWLAAIVFVMTVKPLSGEWAPLALSAAIPAIFGLAAAVLLRAPAAPVTAAAGEQG
jgi:uncharacterized membrane protein